MDDKNNPSSTPEASVDQAEPKAVASPVGPAPAKNKRNKKLLIGGISGAVVVLLVAAAVVLYNVWYQNPNKVVVDTLMNAMTSEKSNFDGKIAVKSDKATVAIKLNGGAVDKQVFATTDIKLKTDDPSGNGSMDINLSADLIAETKDDQATAYFKVNDLDKVVDDLLNKYVDSTIDQYKKYGYSDSSLQKMRESALKQAHSQIDPVIKSINNRWIKASSDVDDSYSCYTDTFAKLRDDKATRKEVMDVYKQNPFLHIDKKLGSENGSLGYQFSIDEDVAEDFSDAVKDTDFSKALKECDDSKTSSTTPSSSKSDSTDEEPVVKVWTNRWSHKLSKVEISGASVSSSSSLTTQKDTADYKFELSFSYDSVDKKDIPSDATDIKDLQKGGVSNLPVSSLLQ